MFDRILKVESYKLLAPSYLSRVISILESFKQGENVLDVGCGRGEITAILDGDQICSIDIAESDLLVSKQRNPEGNFVNADAAHLPFKENTFQNIVCTEVLQYLKKDQSALQEITRVLKNRGTAFLTVPNKNYPILYDPIGFFFPDFAERKRTGLWGYGKTLRLYESEKIENLVTRCRLIIDRKVEISRSIVCIFDNAYTTPLAQRIVGKKLQSAYLQDDFKHTDKGRLEKLGYWTRLAYYLALKGSWLICNLDKLLCLGSGTYIFIKATKT